MAAVTYATPTGVDFRGLVAWVVKRGRPMHVKQRTTAWAARAAGISKQHLFNLMSGKRSPSPLCVAKIAHGWRIAVSAVESAMANRVAP